MACHKKLTKVVPTTHTHTSMGVFLKQPYRASHTHTHTLKFTHTSQTKSLAEATTLGPALPNSQTWSHNTHAHNKNINHPWSFSYKHTHEPHTNTNTHTQTHNTYSRPAVETSTLGTTITISQWWSSKHKDTQQRHTNTHGLFLTGIHIGLTHTQHTHTHTHSHIHTQHSQKVSGRDIHTWTCPSKLTNMHPQHTRT